MDKLKYLKMTKQEILEKVSEILLKYTNQEDLMGKSISMETSILEDLKINSARFIDIILDFEDTFDIEIADDLADQIATVGESVDAIYRLAVAKEN